MATLSPPLTIPASDLPRPDPDTDPPISLDPCPSVDSSSKGASSPPRWKLPSDLSSDFFAASFQEATSCFHHVATASMDCISCTTRASMSFSTPCLLAFLRQLCKWSYGIVSVMRDPRLIVTYQCPLSVSNPHLLLLLEHIYIIQGCLHNIENQVVGQV